MDSRKVCVTNSPEHLCDIYIHVNSCLLVRSWQVTHQTIRCLYHLISHESALCCISYNCQFSFFSLKVANLYVLQRRLCISLFTLFWLYVFERLVSSFYTELISVSQSILDHSIWLRSSHTPFWSLSYQVPHFPAHSTDHWNYFP